MSEVAKKARVSKVTIKLGKKEVDLSLEEAKDLHEALEKMFGKEVITIPQPYPIYPEPVRPYWERYPWYPQPLVVWTSDNANAQVTYASS